MDDTREAFMEIKQSITVTQMSKSYKICLFLKRFRVQALMGNWRERKDFAKWIVARLFCLEPNTKALCSFDNLENAKKECDQLEMRVAGKMTSIVRKDTQQVWFFDELSYSGNLGETVLSEMAKALNDMGFDVNYVFLREGKYALCEEPVSRRFNLQKTKKRDLVSQVDQSAVFIFLNAREEFEQYIAFGKQNELRMFFLEELVNEETCLVDNALFEPDLKYAKPPDINEKRGKRKIVLVEGAEEKSFDVKLLNETAKKYLRDFEFYVLGNELAAEIRLSPNIYFIGYKYMKDMPMYYAYADFIFVPIRDDCSMRVRKMFCRQIVMGKKIVTAISRDIGLPNVISGSFSEDIGKAFEDPAVDISSAKKFGMEHSYYKLCNGFLSVFDSSQTPLTMSIIVLNRNNKKVIFRCVETLLKFNTYQYEVIVVDNDSTDGSYEMLLKKYGKNSCVKIIRNSQNGCSSGRNLGVEHAKGEYIFFLDSDQWIIGDHWMDIALKIMKEHIGIGAVAWNAGWFYPGKLSALIVDYLPNRGMQADMLYRTDIGLLATSGFLMRKRIFKAIGGFDEFYDPTCFEDTDLTLKIRNYGCEVAYTPYMLIRHLPHQTTKSGSAWHTRLMERNEQYCKEKWEKIDAGLFHYYY